MVFTRDELDCLIAMLSNAADDVGWIYGHEPSCKTRRSHPNELGIELLHLRNEFSQLRRSLSYSDEPVAYDFSAVITGW
jgi:hypothetical protein